MTLRVGWTIRLILTSIPFVASDASAGVIVVDMAGGPGSQFTAIQPAVDAATDGDIIVIRAGQSYGAPQIDDKSLTLVGDGVVSIGNSWSTLSPFSVSNLSAGKRVVLRGLTLVGESASTYYWKAFDANNNAGSIWLDSCKFVAVYYAVAVTHCADVVITHCEAKGSAGFPVVSGPGLFYMHSPYPALVAEGSRVYVHASTLAGGNGADCYFDSFLGWGAQAGAAAAVITGGSAVFAGCSLTGGSGGDGFANATYGTCGSPKAGGSGLVLATGNPVVRLVATTLLPGATGLPAGACTAPPPAPPADTTTGTLIELPGDPGDLDAPSPIRESQAIAIAVAHAAGDAALLLVAASPQSALLPQFAGALHVGPPFVVMALGTIPGSGTLSVPFVVPQLPPALLGVDLFLQGATCPQTGACALTAPAAVTVLDASL